MLLRSAASASHTKLTKIANRYSEDVRTFQKHPLSPAQAVRPQRFGISHRAYFARSIAPRQARTSGLEKRHRASYEPRTAAMGRACLKPSSPVASGGAFWRQANFRFCGPAAHGRRSASCPVGYRLDFSLQCGAALNGQKQPQFAELFLALHESDVWNSLPGRELAGGLKGWREKAIPHGRHVDPHYSAGGSDRMISAHRCDRLPQRYRNELC